MDILSMIVMSVIIGLIILAVISFMLFIKRLLINSSARRNESMDIGKKLDKIIEQNEQLLLLLKEKR